MVDSSLQSDLEKLAGEMGADLFGVADLTVAHDLIFEKEDYLGKFPWAVSIGFRLIDSVVDALIRHSDPAVVFTYLALYDSVNSRLDQIALLTAKKIQETGYLAYPVPASQSIDAYRFSTHKKLGLTGAFSHKLAAHLAGLGWIGKSCLLITPQYGPRVRFATVLTNAPLKAGSPIDPKCGVCRECVDICPPKAFTGVDFNASEPREIRFNAHLCRDYCISREDKLGVRMCGLCVSICPYGRS
jgi:epoxyqueuosine reductase